MVSVVQVEIVDFCTWCNVTLILHLTKDLDFTYIFLFYLTQNLRISGACTYSTVYEYNSNIKYRYFVILWSQKCPIVCNLYRKPFLNILCIFKIQGCAKGRNTVLIGSFILFLFDLFLHLLFLFHRC